MDSSRNGLLSTILMTLPLIAVPAMALLRPPGQPGGVSTSPLNAEVDDFDEWAYDSDAPVSDDALDEFGFAEEDPLPPARKKKSGGKSFKDNFESMFDSNPGPGSAARKSAPVDPAARGRKGGATMPLGPLKDPFVDEELGDEDDESGQPATDESDAANVSEDPDADKLRANEIVKQLTAQGAIRTMWFDAGAKSPVGFAVFFRGESENVRIRFEAVGQTRDECAAHVMKQVEAWQNSESSN